VLLQNLFMFNNNKDFDVDLAKGQRNEKRIADILGLGEEKIEIKTEYNFWQKSGNLCIEIENYRKPSGLKTTKAKYWIQSFNNGETIIGFTAVSVPILKKIVSKFLLKNKKRKHEVIRMLGDNNASKCVLIPMTEFIDLWRSIEIKNQSTKAN
jgi:hypothetical protein